MGYSDLALDFSFPVQALHGLAAFWSMGFPIVFLQYITHFTYTGLSVFLFLEIWSVFPGQNLKKYKKALFIKVLKF